MINESNINLDILKHPYYGHSKKLIDSFYIIGYKSKKAKNKIIPLINNSYHENHNEDCLLFNILENKNKNRIKNNNKNLKKLTKGNTNDICYYKYYKKPIIINNITSYKDKQFLDEDEKIIDEIYQEIPKIYTSSLSNKNLIKSLSYFIYMKKEESMQEKEKRNNSKEIHFDIFYIGYVFKFYEKIIQDNEIYYFPKSFCIVSQYPFFNFFNYVMNHIYYLFTEGNNSTEIPIEILLYNIVNYIPSPYFNNLSIEVFPTTLLVQYQEQQERKEHKELEKKEDKKENKISNNLKDNNDDDNDKSNINSDKSDDEGTNKKRIVYLKSKTFIKNGECLPEIRQKNIQRGSLIPKSKKNIDNENNKNNELNAIKDEKEILEKKNLDFLGKEAIKSVNINQRNLGQLTGYPTFDIDLHYIFEILDTSKLIKIFIYNLLELPIVFFSEDLKTLFIVIYIIASLSYPFNDYEKINIFSETELNIFKNNPRGNNLPILSSLHGINEKYNEKEQYVFFGDFYFSVDLDNYDSEIKLERKKKEHKKNQIIEDLKKLDKFVIDSISDKKVNSYFLKDIILNLVNQINKFIDNFDLNLTENSFFVNDDRIIKTNKKIQYIFFISLFKILRYFYTELAFVSNAKFPNMYNKNNNNENKSKEDLNFNIYLMENNLRNKFSNDENIFYNLFKITNKFNYFFNNFIIRKTIGEKLDIPFSFTEEFLHQSILSDIFNEMEIRKDTPFESDTNKVYKDLYYFRFIDHLFYVAEEKSFFHFNFSKFYAYYYSHLTNFFNDYSIKPENISIIRQGQMCGSIKRIIIKYSYQSIELNEDIIYKYSYIISNLTTELFPKYKLRKAVMNVYIPRRKIVNSVEKKFSKNKELTAKKYYLLTMLLIICLTTEKVEWEEQYKIISTIDSKDNLFFRKYLSLIAYFIYLIIINNINNDEVIKQKWTDFISIMLYLEEQKTIPNYEIMTLFNELNKLLKDKQFNIDYESIKKSLIINKKKNKSENVILNTLNKVNIINSISGEINFNKDINQMDMINEDNNNSQIQQRLNYIEKNDEFQIKLQNNYCKDKIVGQVDILKYINVQKTYYKHQCVDCNHILTPILVYKNKFFKRKVNFNILPPGKIYYDTQNLISQYFTNDLKEGIELVEFKEKIQNSFECIIVNLFFHLQLQQENEENKNIFNNTADENTIASIEYIKKCFRFNFLA